MALTLTTDERAELERRVRSLKIRAEDARRARVILMLANGESYSTIEATVPCYRDYINRWRRRFLADRLDGLRAAVSRPAADGADADDGSPHPGEDAAGAARRQHALEYAEAGARAEDSSQPRRQSVAARRPAAASVRAVHAVGRSRLRTESRRRDRPVSSIRPIMRPSSRSMRRRRFRRSTASIPCCRCRPAARSAMASSTTGTARCRCSPRSIRSRAKCSADGAAPHQRGLRRVPRRHRGQPAEGPRDSRDRRQPLDPQDASGPHLSASTHPHVQIHFTPTYSSWLNQVELWFAKIERDLLARGIFTSVADLARKIRRYIRHYNTAREADSLELSQPGASN